MVSFSDSCGVAVISVAFRNFNPLFKKKLILNLSDKLRKTNGVKIKAFDENSYPGKLSFQEA